MTWYRSEMRPLTADLIDHHFHCVACGTTLIIPTNMKGETPGDKGYLSKPISPRAAFVRRGFIWAGTRVIRGQRKPLRSFIRTRS